MTAFAGHRAGGGGGDFLRKWKDAGKFDAWHHTKVMPIALWIHKIPKIVSVKKDGVTTVHVWGDQLVCHETEGTLEGQYFRDKETNERKHPPKRCGMCKLVEWCFQQCLAFELNRAENEEAIEAKKLGKVKGIRFTTPMFRFEGDVADEAQTLTIGGIANIYARKDLGDEAKADIQKAKIVVGGLKGAWRENAYAKCHYAMCVVNNDRPDDGVQIAVETSGLGNAVKGVINAVTEEDGRDLAADPYVIRWKFDKNASMNDMYTAVPMRKLKPSPRILKLIRGDAPEEALDRLTERFNQKEVRSTLEKYCLPEFRKLVPWDSLFPTEAQEKQWAKEDAEEEAAAEALAEQEGGSSTDVEERAQREPGDDEEEDDDGGEEDETDEDGNVLFECDNEDCKAPVKATDTECAKCGHKYEVVEEEKPAPTPPPKSLPSRKEALARAAAAKKAKDGGGSEGDEIPFG